MTIGTGIVLIIVGAILTFAINVQVDVVDLDLIGYILMIGGAIVVLLGLVMMTVRRGRSSNMDGEV